MGIEIERKYLIKNDGWKAQADAGKVMRQGYMSRLDTASVRVRIANDKAHLNIKSVTLGVRRLEYEYEVPLSDAEEMLDQLCGGKTVDKTRYEVEHDGLVWEIDVFTGANEGLIVAEVELESEDQAFNLPEWVGQEVSDDTRYYNVNLLDHPYNQW